MKYSVVIVAGGSGKRMGSEVPKQFLPIGDKPVIVHTIEKFLNFDQQIQVIVVIPEQQKSRFEEIARLLDYAETLQTTSGGLTRFQSVKNGLQKVTGQYVAIHDAVRPFVSNETIRKCFESAAKTGSGIPVIDAVDSIREVKDGENRALIRQNLKYVQTPQVFKTSDILSAYNQSESDAFTDDASVFESAGKKVTLVEGNIENIKITNPADIALANFFLQC